jgi:hypothetical protein
VITNVGDHVTVAAALATVKERVTSGAAKYDVVCAADAVIEHGPALRIVTVVPLTEHTSGVVDIIKRLLLGTDAPVANGASP